VPLENGASLWEPSRECCQYRWSVVNGLAVRDEAVFLTPPPRLSVKVKNNLEPRLYALMNSEQANPWRNQSRITRVGRSGTAIDELPSSPAALREASQRLVAHYMGNSDGSTGPITGERLKEVDLRYADAMFGRLLEMGAPQLSRDRPPEERLPGCCRDFAVLFVSMARHKGIPARVRFGYPNFPRS
jgi:hypothetical protein